MRSLRASILRRWELRRRTDYDSGFGTREEIDRAREIALRQARADPVRFISDWCWTYDPRVKPYTLPFDLWPRQVLWIRFLEAMQRDTGEAVGEKSRDVGMSWMNAAFSVHRWRFEDGCKISVVGDKQDTVDKLGDLDSLLEKCRFIINGLPPWMLPPIFDPRLDLRFKSIRNRSTGSAITAKTGDNAGRGGRSTVIFIDEAAHIPRAKRLDAAVTANSDTRIWVSSVNGNGNTFAQKAQSGRIPVFRFHYRDDPRKDETWVAEMRRTTDEVIWAQEREIDYGASITNVIVPNSAMIAARELGRRLLDPRASFVRQADADRLRLQLARYADRQVAGIAGLDVGGGRAESALLTRHGPLAAPPLTWGNPDTTDTAEKAASESVRRRCGYLFYDVVGVGRGVQSTLARIDTPSMLIQAVNTGMPPSDRVWPDGRTAAEIFKNIRAEVWWMAREALRAAEELLAWLDGRQGGFAHPLEDVLLLPDDDELGRQLVTITWSRDNRGKIVVESKEDLDARGVVSPDRADALVLTFTEPATSAFYVG